MSPIYIHRLRGQCMGLLMAALADLGGSNTKQSVLAHIIDRRWFNLQAEDKKPYPSNQHTSREPRWHTLIAWARQDCVERNLMHSHEHDAWALTRNGHKEWNEKRAGYASGRFLVSECFPWSPEFKKYMYAPYEPSAKDLQRPSTIYEDVAREKQLSDREKLLSDSGIDLTLFRKLK